MSDALARVEVSRVLRNTGKAILVVLVEDEREAWIPQSLIHADSEVWDEEHGEGTLIVPMWFAEKEKLI